MKDSPFIYGSTVSVHAFTNRELETKSSAAIYLMELIQQLYLLADGVNHRW
jgi:hypothetical protein